jgi:transcriptional regulator with XRE-family HTH domain
MAQAEPTDDFGEVQFGQRLRQRRKDLGLTLRELANQTGLTASFLSQVERGRTSLSVDSLRRVIDALGLSILNFLDNIQAPEPVVRGDRRPKLTLSGSEVSYELLVPDLSRRMEVFIGRIGPGEGNVVVRPPLREPTEECVYLLEGKLKVGLVRGDYLLEAGDSIYFEGGELLEIANASETLEAVWISMITPPVY